MRPNPSVALLIASLSIYSPPADASEFANLFGSAEIEKQSREASATILEGIQMILEEIKRRELTRAASPETFKEAANTLQKAAFLMRAILSEAQDPMLSTQLRDEDFQHLHAIYGTAFEGKTIRELYAKFADDTDRLANRISDISRDTPAYPQDDVPGRGVA